MSVIYLSVVFIQGEGNFYTAVKTGGRFTGKMTSRSRVVSMLECSSKLAFTFRSIFKESALYLHLAVQN